MNKLLFISTILATSVFATEFPLEWNRTYDADFPYEIDLSPEKIAKLGGNKPTANYIVKATCGGAERELPVTVLRGRLPRTLTLRFVVPAGTTALKCCTGNEKVSLVDSETTDNLFAGAVNSAAKWKMSANAKATQTDDGGVLLANTRGGNSTATYTIDVPEKLAGKPVFIEIDVKNVAKMTSGSTIFFDQLDAMGKVLPEALSDPRWLCHMRPVNKLQKLREEGRIHPLARKLALKIGMSDLGSASDEYGMPIKTASDNWPALKIERLAVRLAKKLPFPKYDDTFFAKGVSEKEGDEALILGDDRAFWYATHSFACWAQSKQLENLSQVFYPDRLGTVEAWLKPTWKKDSARKYNIFTANHRYNSNAARNILPKNDAMTVKYTPSSGQLEFVLVDWSGKPFSKNGKVELAADQWNHLAVQWDPAKTADLYVNGKRVITIPLDGFAEWNLKTRTEVQPNGRIPLEFYVGANYSLGRITDSYPVNSQFYPGAIDNLRVSSVCRYRGDFVPAKEFKLDADTRALFDFNRNFDGVSGGGAGFISGTILAKNDRVDHQLEIISKGKKVQYLPAENEDYNNPFKVFSNLNYTVLPTQDDFAALRQVVTKSAVMKNGDVLKVNCRNNVRPEYVEFANEGTTPLRHPALVNKGEFDPRSFGDLADSLMNGREKLSDRERANAVFQFVLGASDYFMQHTITFPEGNDSPEMVVYKALMMLNGYCGFECGPLNNMAANLFACVARCPSSSTGGYGHEFEQVHFDGKNHTYDLSAQKFFPAMDNETASCLGESEDQPGVFNRIGGHSGSFIRTFTRSYASRNPAYQAKVAMVLNPGERFRVWQANDGHVNDLHIHSWAKGENPEKSSYREDYTAQTHATVKKNQFLTRMDRYFPHYLNGFVMFNGKPSATNPAFTKVQNDSFCYQVRSCYPIVHGEYSAKLASGKRAALEISTDGGKTFRDIAEVLDYEVRARVGYLIRVKAPISSVKEFNASTEVMINPRVFPGRVHAGMNEMLFKSTDESNAKVTVAWREEVKKAFVKGGVLTGTIPGMEKQVVFLNPAEPLALEMVGFSPKAKVFANVLSGAASGGAKKGPAVNIAGNRLQIAAAKGEPEPSIASIKIVDGKAERVLYVVTTSNMRYVPVTAAEKLGGSTLNTDDTQPSVMCKKSGDGVRFAFNPVPAGKYAVYFADRFASDTPSPGELNREVFNLTWTGASKSANVRTGSAGNQGVNLYKARYGNLTGRANYKWDYVLDNVGYHPYFPRYKPRVLTFGANTSNIDFTIASNCDKGAELIALLVVPLETEREFMCELTKILCGMNTDPARMAR